MVIMTMRITTNNNYDKINKETDAMVEWGNYAFVKL